MRSAIGENNAVYAKLGVVRLVTKVTSICPESFSTRRSGFKTLIDPIPYEPPLHGAVFAKAPPIFVQTSVTIAHRVAVFTQNHRAMIIQILIGHPLTSVYSSIHGAYNISATRARPTRFIVQGTSRVVCSGPLSHSSLTTSTSCLVSKRPHDYRSVVAISLNHASHS